MSIEEKEIEIIRNKEILAYLILYHQKEEIQRFPIQHGKYVFGRSPKTREGVRKLCSQEEHAIDKEQGVSSEHFYLEAVLELYKAKGKWTGSRSFIIRDTSTYGTAISKRIMDGPQFYLSKYDEVYLEYDYIIYLLVDKLEEGKLFHAGHYKLKLQTPKTDETTQKMVRNR